MKAATGQALGTRLAKAGREKSYLVELSDEEDLAKLRERQEIAVVEIDTGETDFVTNPQATAISVDIKEY